MESIEINDKTFYYNYNSDKRGIMKEITEQFRIGMKLDDILINENYIINDHNDYSQEFKRNSWGGVFKSRYNEMVIILSSNLLYLKSVQYEIINIYKELMIAKSNYDKYNKDYENPEIKFNEDCPIKQLEDKYKSIINILETKLKPIQQLENKYKSEINILETEFNNMIKVRDIEIREKDKEIREKDKQIKLLMKTNEKTEEEN